jgi:serine/threonine-protein kinase
MAEVYRARDLRLDRVVAVKTLRPDLARDQTFQARFRREAQSAASLNHPTIVAVYDTGEDMATGVPVPYIVMEYVDGRTVRDLLMEGQRLLPERVLDITNGVLRALEYSHQAGIVHRDIKPGNVMVTRNGDIKVMDFGIARAMNDSQATMTQTAQVIGTAQYLSPEQARGERVDARSDLYSTGCLMYELLVGRPPFTGDSPVAIAYQHVRENPVPPSNIDPALPPWADGIVLRAMAKSPNDRYQSAADMQADLQRARSGMQVSAPPSPTRMDYYGGGYAEQTQRMGAQTMMAPGTQALPPYQQGGGYDDYDRGYDGSGGGRGRKWVPWLIGAIVVIAAIVVAVMLLANTTKGTFVPIVQGDSQTQAVTAVKDAGFVPQVTDQNSNTVAKGKVINTNPQGGSSATKGSAVTIYVSEGQAKVTVPTITSCESDSAAEAALTNANLVPNQVSDPTSTCPANTVDHITPSAGTLLAPGQQVTLYIAGGGAVPQSVVGYQVNTAEEILKAQGFTDIATVYTNAPSGGGPMTAGTVWKQQAAGTAGASVPFGAKITLFVQATTTTPPSQSPTPSPSTTPTTPSGSPSASPSASASASATPTLPFAPPTG